MLLERSSCRALLSSVIPSVALMLLIEESSVSSNDNDAPAASEACRQISSAVSMLTSALSGKSAVVFAACSETAFM
jgi:hypothetical protein